MIDCCQYHLPIVANPFNPTWLVIGAVVTGSAGASWGAGDVVGILFVKGLSENVSDDGLDLIEEGGRELRVPSREPSGVKTAG